MCINEAFVKYAKQGFLIFHSKNYNSENIFNYVGLFSIKNIILFSALVLKIAINKKYF